MTIQWTAFPLHPETPGQGSTLEALFAGRGIDIPLMLDHLKQTADDLGLEFGHRTMTYNSRRAQELGKWARDQGREEAFHTQAFHAYFAQGRNIARLDSLREVVAAAGLDPDQAMEVLNQQDYKAAVDQDWQRARRMGIHAVPTFHMDGRLLEGAQTYTVLYDWINS